MRIPFALLVLTSGVATACGIAYWTLAGGDGPRLAVSLSHLDLGEGEPGQRLDGSVSLVNDGTQPLHFSLVASCGCTHLSPREGTIEPGMSQPIEVALELYDHAGSQRTVTFHVKSDDLSAPSVEITATGRCPKPFDVTPAVVDFGEVLTSELTNKKQTLMIRGKGGEPLKNPEALMFEIEGDLFRVASNVIDGAVEVAIIPEDDVPAGDKFTSLDISSAETDAVVRVPIHVRVLPPVSTVPSTLYLQLDSTVIKPAECILISNVLGTPLGDVSLLGGPPGTRVLEVIALDASRSRVRLEFDSEVLRSEGTAAGHKFKVLLGSAASDNPACINVLLSAKH